jgi:flagellar biosynthetic protein FliO
MNSLLAVVIVLGLVGALAWLLRSGHRPFRATGSIVGVETAISLGERRQLVIVAVEGRRLLLGVTSAQVTLVTELQAATQIAPASRSAIDDFESERPRQ